MDKDTRKRYIRWQDYRIKQLSFATNLFLSFAIASLGFTINLKLAGKVQDPLFLVPVIEYFGISAVLGAISTISRLFDFRYTARKIKNGGNFNKFMAKYCGFVTWATFYFQVVTYGIGAYLFIIKYIGFGSIQTLL